MHTACAARVQAYGDYETLCPRQTFTQAALQKSFPGSTEEPWTLIERWGPTASGLEGFNVVIPGEKRERNRRRTVLHPPASKKPSRRLTCVKLCRDG